MALGLTIPGGNGAPPLVFKVSGQSLGVAASDASKALAVAKAAGTYTVNVVTPGESTPAHPQAPAGTVVNELLDTSNSLTSYAPATGEFTLALNFVPTTITGSAGGNDTVFGGGSITYDAVGNNNEIAFISGSNTYTSSGANTGDTVFGGAGFDTITTGAAFTTVFGGSGSTLINLNDTKDSVAGSAAGGVVYLGDGHASVNAMGAYDIVVAGVSGQTINGSGQTSTSASLDVVLGSKTSNPLFNGSDLVIAGAATTTVFDSVGGNTIFGGSGQFDFIGEVRPGLVVADTIAAGTGSTAIFGSNENDLTISSQAGTPVVTVIAGLGNETLNGANATGGGDFFMSTDTTGAATSAINDTVVGSNFYNYFQTGAGNEAVVGGTGENIFGITDTATANISVFDFTAGSNNTIQLLNSDGSAMTQDQVSAITNSETTFTAGGEQGVTLTLSDNSTVSFYNIADISTFNSHIV